MGRTRQPSPVHGPNTQPVVVCCRASAQYGTVTDVVGIHGIAQQQSGRYQLLDAWLPALRDGVERATNRDRYDPTLDLVYYGDLFLRSVGEIKGPAVLDDLSEDSLRFLADLQEEIVDPFTPADPAKAKRGLKELPTPVARLATWLDNRFGAAGKILFFGDLVQVRRYQRDDELAAKILDRATDVLALRPRVLVGHSLGSVIAYDILCRVPDHGVETLITLGSPLALHTVRHGLRPPRSSSPRLPPGVARWVNVYDPHDAVACAGGVQPHWTEAVDRVVDNERDPHAVTRYLGKRPTGEAVLAGLET